MASNPKVLVFFGAFIPQFVAPGADQTGQLILLCATAMAVAAISDSLYAVLTGRARALFSPPRAHPVGRRRRHPDRRRNLAGADAREIAIFGPRRWSGALERTGKKAPLERRGPDGYLPSRNLWIAVWSADRPTFSAARAQMSAIPVMVGTSTPSCSARSDAVRRSLAISAMVKPAA